MPLKLTCSRCGREIEKRGFCPHCRREEANERQSIAWHDLTTLEVIRLDEQLEEKYKNAGQVKP